MSFQFGFHVSDFITDLLCSWSFQKNNTDVTSIFLNMHQQSFLLLTNVFFFYLSTLKDMFCPVFYASRVFTPKLLQTLSAQMGKVFLCDYSYCVACIYNEYTVVDSELNISIQTRRSPVLSHLLMTFFFFVLLLTQVSTSTYILYNASAFAISDYFLYGLKMCNFCASRLASLSGESDSCWAD